ncbi:MFS transporter [Amycolatopsis rhabdoformis]|uniref:MFS transporter n=1 Tax=Amycolatopsis rhabdoformis TaxID=1448059 RepID=A0ABZ1IA02_9PSEU|nr:MFS transporter [Amycolatopsis rhabdoformis]WSE31304.1 MFS transporter [Amycolatopsis rhabdoformis]
MSIDLRAARDTNPMSRLQWAAVTVCMLLNLLDGFDVLVMAFTGKFVAAEWQLSATELGLLLSAAPVGMAVGSMFVAPWADRIGRRRIILACLVVSSVAMILSSLAPSAGVLGALRVVSGLGIGAIIAGGSVASAEFANRRWRGLAVSLNATGYALGATLGGLIAVLLIGGSGWRSVFLFGGIATALAIPLVVGWLPESLDFLLTRRPPGALERVNRLAARCGLGKLDALPEQTEAPRGIGAGYRELLKPKLRRTTLLMWLVFFLVMAGFYFVTSWTPTLLLTAGLSSAQGLTASTLLNLGGVFGAALLGVLTARFALRKVLIGYLIGTGLLLGVFIASTQQLSLAFVVGIGVGLFVNGCVAGLFAFTATVYEPAVRATGFGTALAISRAGAILAPFAAGALLDTGMSPQGLYLGAGGVFLVTAAVLSLVRTRTATYVPAASAAVR